MIDLLLYATITCEDAAEIIQRVNAHEEMMAVIKDEIVLTIQEATPECPWDAND
jgi:ribosomal protein L14|tara:strand:- start:980 stop:1141 length:162 start_codon:yes stop_codon:yes gene_type:complete